MKEHIVRQPPTVLCRRSRMIVAFALVGTVFASFAQATSSTSSAREDPRIIATKERYAFDAWQRTDRRSDGFPVSALRYSGYTEEAEVDFMPGEPVVRRFRSEEGIIRFLVELSAHETAAQARELLVGYLTFVSSPKTLPTTASLGIAAGDIGFVGSSRDNRISWIAFARGNITVRICCLDPRADPHPDMAYVAKQTDRQILAQPALGLQAPLTRPVITRLDLHRSSCKAGEVVPLDLRSTRIIAEHWVIEGSGQGYVEKDRNGQWRLHTTGSGTIKLVCHVLGSNGFATSKSVSIRVEPE